MPVFVAALCCLLISACSYQNAPPAPVGAGIIAVACKDGTAYYLLARERASDRLGWGHLGGTRNANEPLLATALREFNEESNCGFDLDRPQRLRLSGPSRSGNFSTYHMKVDYRPASHIADSTACRTDERDQWVWIRRADLLAALQNDAHPMPVSVAEGGPDSVRLWKPAADALRQALADTVIPGQDPCSD